jgi:hypothetical protein
MDIGNILSNFGISFENANSKIRSDLSNTYNNNLNQLLEKESQLKLKLQERLFLFNSVN